MAGVGLALAIRKQILKKPTRQLQLERQKREKLTALSNERQAGLRRAYDVVLGDKNELRAQIKELAKVAGCDPAVVKFYFTGLRKQGKKNAKMAEPKNKAAAKALRDNPKKKNAAQAYRDKNKAAAKAFRDNPKKKKAAQAYRDKNKAARKSRDATIYRDNPNKRGCKVAAKALRDNKVTNHF